MSGQIVISYDQQMNGSIFITLPTSTILIQGHGQSGVADSPCNCKKINPLSETKNIKEENNDTEQEIMEINDEKRHNIKEEIIELDTEIDEYIMHKDINLYQNVFSPISLAVSDDIENSQPSVSEDEDDDFETYYTKQLFADIPEILEYLKQNVM